MVSTRPNSSTPTPAEREADEAQAMAENRRYTYEIKQEALARVLQDLARMTGKPEVRP
jgi:hypothetical protein